MSVMLTSVALTSTTVSGSEFETNWGVVIYVGVFCVIAGIVIYLLCKEPN